MVFALLRQPSYTDAAVQVNLNNDVLIVYCTTREVPSIYADRDNWRKVF